MTEPEHAPDVNAYSGTWFQLFLDALPAGQTDRETAFLARQLPRPAFGHVLDVCCGSGRHAHALANRGYRVVGLDRDRAALARAAATAPPGCTFVEGDLRRVSAPGGPFDAVTCLWQSFGFFDAAGNRAVLHDLHGLLRPGGRLVLDVYHRDFFEANQGTRTFTRGGPEVTQQISEALRSPSMPLKRAKRVTEMTAVGSGAEGHLLSPSEELKTADGAEGHAGGPPARHADVRRSGHRTGCRRVRVGPVHAAGAGRGAVRVRVPSCPALSCRDFDETRPAAGSTPRFQLVAERLQGRAGGGTPLPRRAR